MTVTAAAPTQAADPSDVFVFVYPCGCPRNAVTGVEDEQAAWHQAAPLGAEKKMLRLEGVTVRHLTAAEYQHTYAALMSQRCPHPRDGR